MTVLAPFPYFGGKRSVAAEVWARLGTPSQYIEPFCGSLAVLLAAPQPAALEVVNDASGFIANFWRAVKHQADEVARWADYPVSHIDLGARHQWLMAQRDRLGASMQDPDWPGDAKVAGWWLWGQCCWIGSGWCDWFGKIPHASDAGMGVQAIGQIPHASDAGRGVQAIGQIPHAGNAGMGEELLTSCGRTAMRWLRQIADRLERVRVVHGHWDRCLNNHFGGDDTAVFLDPPYRSYEKLYGGGQACSRRGRHVGARERASAHRALRPQGRLRATRLGRRRVVARPADLQRQENHRSGMRLVFAGLHQARQDARPVQQHRASRSTQAGSA